MTSFLGVPHGTVLWSGDLVERESSPGTRRGFCADCGSPMSYRSDQWPDEIHLYAATLADPTVFKPEAHYHWAERVPWLIIADDLPKYPGSADG